MSILDLARPEIRALTPYSSARMEARGGAVMLNANESPLPNVGAALNRYPEPQPAELLVRVAALYGVAAEQVLIGRGSDEAIDLLVRAFCTAGRDAVLICPPTFGMYAVCAHIQNAAVVEAPLGADFSLDVPALLAAATAQTKLVFLCSPNNPTGGAIAASTIETVARAFAGRALVVVDEAYVEFSNEASAIALLARHENLAVLRTLSKAHALAGARVGTVLGTPELIALLRRIQAPYPLPTPCVDAALAALEPAALGRTRERIAALLRERERLAQALRGAPRVRAVLPSQANFVCARFDDGAAVYRALLAQGIVVRDVGRYPALRDCLRLSVGTAAENARLIAALGAAEVAA
jgi:histidinol-phosphate aminotransferase